jgi:prepilin-type N-terminal cleavage/methylation domain-containing protein
MNLRGNRLSSRFSVRAFTLVELMIVCAIIGAVLTIAIPTIYRYFHPESLEGTVRSLMEALSHARARAILNGAPVELVIRPGDRTFQVSQSASAPSGEFRGIVEVDGPARLESRSVSGENWRLPDREVSRGTTHTVGGGGGSDESSAAFSGRIAERIIIEMLDVNFFELKDAEAARVRFYPNGTSDEFTIVLHGENEQWRKITLEVVTGLPDLSSDPSKWMHR